MNKVCVLWMLWLFASATHANPNTTQASAAIQDAKRYMKDFNPADAIPFYQANPSESNLKLSEDGTFGEMVNAGARRAQDDETTRFITTHHATRGKITPNPNAEEIQFAERLIDTSDAAIHESCHDEPVPCIETHTEKTCEESMTYIPASCEEHVTVHLHRLAFPSISRMLAKGATTLDLTACTRFKNALCSPIHEIILHARCEHIDAKVTYAGVPLALLKTPTCDDPSLIVDVGHITKLFQATIQVTEYWSDADERTQMDCANLKEPTPNGMCVPESIDACMDSNQTKLIDGIPVTRRCWGQAQTYRCPNGMTSTCGALLDAGCSNTSSTCTATENNVCEQVSKTFQCTEKTCFPDREVCDSPIGCADGSCDLTHDEPSDDANEGFSRLGALAGVAEDAALHQTQTGEATIFKGDALKCVTHPLGTRDCCTDSGFLEGLMHCPPDMQLLQRAKVENRVIALGDYWDDVYGSKRYVYCVFPTQLARIIQFQGRQGQLHIPFGTPKHPDCRGLTPEQLEHMDFSQFDLSAFIQDVTQKTMLPADNASDAPNATHVESMFEKGVPHD